MESSPASPKRFVHITNYYHNASGGVRTNYDMLLREAERRERHHTLIVPGEKSEIIETGRFTRIYKVAARPAPMFDRRYRMMLPNQYLFHGSPIRDVLLKEKPAAIEIYDNYSLTFLAGMIRKGKFRRLGRPLLIYFTGERFDTIFASFVLSGRFGRWFSRTAMGNFNLAMFDYFIANSTFVADELFDSVNRGLRGRVSSYALDKCWEFFRNTLDDFADRVSVCPRGVDTTLFGPQLKSSARRAEIARDLGFPATAFLLISSTRLSPEKNVRLLPQIMKILSLEERYDFRLIVAGDGPERAKLERESAAAAAGRIAFIGHQPRERLAELYANADAFIHPNPREPFGNVGLEAMASGVNVIVPNSGGVLTYANESNAWLAKATAEAFAARILEMAQNPEIAERKCKAALKTAEENNVDSAFNRLFSNYDRMYSEFYHQQTAAAAEVSDERLEAAVHTTGS